MPTADPQPQAIIDTDPELQEINKKQYLVAGLNVNAFFHESTVDSKKPVQIHFLLHWRAGTHEDVEPAARKIVLLAHQESNRECDLMVITFNHRNHGDRMLDRDRNMSWDEGNLNHGPDMYSFVLGGARDVSLLIDFLPLYLYPKNQRKISEWGVSGVSLGGHTAWLLLAYEKRLTTGVIVIGCPSYSQFVINRALGSNYPLEAPYIPAGFLDLIRNTSAENVEHIKQDKSNPFMGKKVMIISGGKDVLVPWEVISEYVHALEVGPSGIKKVHVHDDVGHAFPPPMILETAQFIATNGRLPENLPEIPP